MDAAPSTGARHGGPPWRQPVCALNGPRNRLGIDSDTMKRLGLLGSPRQGPFTARTRYLPTWLTHSHAQAAPLVVPTGIHVDWRTRGCGPSTALGLPRRAIWAMDPGLARSVSAPTVAVGGARALILCGRQLPSTDRPARSHLGAMLRLSRSLSMGYGASVTPPLASHALLLFSICRRSSQPSPSPAHPLPGPGLPHSLTHSLTSPPRCRVSLWLLPPPGAPLFPSSLSFLSSHLFPSLLISFFPCNPRARRGSHKGTAFHASLRSTCLAYPSARICVCVFLCNPQPREAPRRHETSADPGPQPLLFGPSQTRQAAPLLRLQASSCKSTSAPAVDPYSLTCHLTALHITAETYIHPRRLPGRVSPSTVTRQLTSPGHRIPCAVPPPTPTVPPPPIQILLGVSEATPASTRVILSARGRPRAFHVMV